MADLADSTIAARVAVNRALEAMGPELAGVALDVCYFMKGLQIVERERQWPVRSAKLMLRTALMALSRHYNHPRPRAGSIWSTGVRRVPAGTLVLWDRTSSRPIKDCHLQCVVCRTSRDLRCRCECIARKSSPKPV